MREWNDIGIDITGLTPNQFGEVATVCPRCSQSRKKKNVKCLSVNIDKKVYHCNHCGWAGSLESGEYRGSNQTTWRTRKFILPINYDHKISDSVISWFAGRGISENTLIKAGVTSGLNYMPQIEAKVNTLEFNYYRNGELVNIKYRDKNKNFRQVAGAEKILYNFDMVKDAKEVIIVEGEIDVLSIIEVGIEGVVSVPDGAPSPQSKNFNSKFDFLESHEDFLNNCEMVVLAGDNDVPGRLLVEELARRIGKEKCWSIKWPDDCKDANDVLVRHGRERLIKCIEDVHPYPIEGIVSVSSLAEKTLNLYDNGLPRGVSPGWHNLSSYYTIMRGEWTLVTGIPSHGKSGFLSDMMIRVGIDDDWSFGVFSSENMPLEGYVSRLVELLINKPFGRGPEERASKEEVERAMDWLNSHIYFINPLNDSVKLSTILEKAKALVYRFGISGLIIDPWNELDHSRPSNMTETEYISDCLSRVRKFSRVYGVHTFIVAHPTKLQKDKDGEYPVPTPYDVQGSSHWRNKADNCLAVFRHSESTRTTIYIQKIRFRHIGKIGDIDLFFDVVTGKYFENSLNDGTNYRTPYKD